MSSLDRLNSLREKLADAETELAALVDASGDMSCLLGRDGRLERLSPAWETRLGCTLGEMLGQPMAEFVHSDDVSATRAVLANLSCGVAEARFANRFRSANGDFHRLEWTALPLGSAGLVYAVATEVAEAQQAESVADEPESFVGLVESIAMSAVETLGSGGIHRLAERSAQIYSSLVGSSPNALLITSAQGRVLMCSKQAASVFALGQPDEMVGQNIFDYMLEEDRERGIAHVDAAMKTGRSPDIAVTMVRSNGAQFPCEISSSAMPDTEGRPRAAVMHVKDLTERRETEEALHRAEELYKRVVETSPDAITMTDLSGRVVLFNQQAVRMHGGTDASEMIGELAFNYIAPEDRERALDNARRTLENGSVRDVEYMLLRKDGSRFPAELSASVIRDSTGAPQGFVGLVRDITERKRMEAELEQIREELERRVERQMQRQDRYGLTFRELTVLHLVSAGNSDKEIGTTLGISHLTVSKHVANILVKMDASSRSEASARAVREGLVD